MSKDPNLAKKFQSVKKLTAQVSFGEKEKDHYRGAGVRIVNVPSHQIVSAGGLVHAKGMNVQSSNKKMLLKKSNNQLGKAPVYKIVTQTQKKSALLSKKGNCTAWDGISPLNTYSSTTYSPEEMSDVVEEVLKNLLNDNVDYEKTSTYLFVGKKFSLSGDSDFRINIFSPGPMSDGTTSCEVEIRKMGGYSFGFAGIQDQIVGLLLKQNAIEKNQGPDLGIIGDTIDGGFQMKPFSILDMDQDSISDFASDSEGPYELTTKSAQNLIIDAVNADSFRDDLRYSVQHLRETLEDKKNVQHFRKISSNGINKMMTFMSQCYDTWMIKTLLESINLLLSNKCQSSQGLSNDLTKLQKKWSKPVVNKVNDSQFQFPASHQIQKLCGTILGKL